MSAEEELFKAGISLLSQHLNIRQEEFINDGELFDYDVFKQKLVALIKYLLENDFDRLLQGMYRMDVRESDFKTALALPTFDQIADSLAKLMIQREMQKVVTRNQYKNKK